MFFHAKQSCWNVWHNIFRSRTATSLVEKWWKMPWWDGKFHLWGFLFVPHVDHVVLVHISCLSTLGESPHFMVFQPCWVRLLKQLNTGPFLGVNPPQNPSGNIWLFPSLKFGPEGGPSADHAVTRITRLFSFSLNSSASSWLEDLRRLWRCWISGGFLLKMWRYHQLDAWFHGLSPKKLMILGYCTTVPPF